jgi:hypothetical protein
VFRDVRDSLNALPFQWAGGGYRQDGEDIRGRYPLFPVRYEITRAIAPTRVFEIGALYGYCLATMALAARDAGVEVEVGWVDTEEYERGSNARCLVNLESLGFTELWWSNRREDAIRFGSAGAVSVDGNHTYEDALIDIDIAAELHADVVFVDDTKAFPAVRDACVMQQVHRAWHAFEVDTMNGLTVLSPRLELIQTAREAATQWHPSPLW